MSRSSAAARLLLMRLEVEAAADWIASTFIPGADEADLKQAFNEQLQAARARQTRRRCSSARRRPPLPCRGARVGGALRAVRGALVRRRAAPRLRVPLHHLGPAADRRAASARSRCGWRARRGVRQRDAARRAVLSAVGARARTSAPLFRPIPPRTRKSALCAASGASARRPRPPKGPRFRQGLRGGGGRRAHDAARSPRRRSTRAR